MEKYKKEFIDFMLECQVLKFGDFVTKSGRKTPFFINTGFYRTGGQLKRLGEFYARALKEHFPEFDLLFGPAYKGIPLSVAASMAMYTLFGREVKYCSNRKEAKDHGDTGILLGSPIAREDRIVMIEDVTTAGTSIEETMPIIKAQGGERVLGLMVSVDRCERGKGEMAALTQISQDYGIKTAAIVTMKEVLSYLEEERPGEIITSKIKAAVEAYYDTYGA